jgi:hypothetical protein
MIKTYGGADAQIHVFFISVLVGVLNLGGQPAVSIG